MRKIYSLFAAVVLAVGVNAQTLKTITINVENIGGTDVLGTSNYNGGAERTWTTDAVDFGGKAITTNPINQPSTGTAAGTLLQCQASKGVIYNTTALPGRLVSVTFNSVGTARQSSLYGGNAGRLVNSTTDNYDVTGGTQVGSASTTGWTSTDLEGTDYTYFAIKRGGSAAYFTSIEIVYEEAAPAEPVLNADATSLDFSQVEISSTSDAQTVTVSGENLTETPTYVISGADAADFNAEGTLTTDGGTINVTFAPTTTGTKSATLTITSGDLTQTVELSGEAVAEGTLSVSNVNAKTSLVKNTSVDSEIIFSQDAKVSIVNMNGQVLKTAQVSANQALNVAALPKGVYVVTAVVNGKVVSQKIIKK